MIHLFTSRVLVEFWSKDGFGVRDCMLEWSGEVIADGVYMDVPWHAVMQSKLVWKMDEDISDSSIARLDGTSMWYSKIGR